MVEGHSCHRLAFQHRKRLVGRRFHASSPNSRFERGAIAINGCVLQRIEVHGKNMFYFFEGGAVVHIHFGMSGHFRVHAADKAPDPTDKTRLKLVDSTGELVCQVTAMMVKLIDDEAYTAKANELGPDPLREDADKERLWQKWCVTSRAVGLLLMDQSAVAGIGNIFRAEILFKAGAHPEQPAETAPREVFERVWFHSVGCLQAGFRLGSIKTVDPEEAKLLGPPWQRRYIYNQATCGRCRSAVLSWDMATRKVYCCPTCQPLLPGTEVPQRRREVIANAHNPRLFASTCATDSVEAKIMQPATLRNNELRALLKARGKAASGKRAELLARIADDEDGQVVLARKVPLRVRVATQARLGSWGGRLRQANSRLRAVSDEAVLTGTFHIERVASSRDAALEKIDAGENRAVEHVAEMDDDVDETLQDRRRRRKQSVKPKPRSRQLSRSATEAGLMAFDRPLKKRSWTRTPPCTAGITELPLVDSPSVSVCMDAMAAHRNAVTSTQVKMPVKWTRQLPRQRWPPQRDAPQHSTFDFTIEDAEPTVSGMVSSSHAAAPSQHPRTWCVLTQSSSADCHEQISASPKASDTIELVEVGVLPPTCSDHGLQPFGDRIAHGFTKPCPGVAQESLPPSTKHAGTQCESTRSAGDHHVQQHSPERHANFRRTATFTSPLKSGVVRSELL